MFEKDAEEYANNRSDKLQFESYTLTFACTKKAFQKEAEEYTKERAKVLGIDDRCLAYYAIQRAYQYGAEFGYNKANEWHYVKDGDLPKDDMYEAVIITPSGEWEKGIFRRIDCECYWRIIGFNENVKVIAWKEIPTFNLED